LGTDGNGESREVSTKSVDISAMGLRSIKTEDLLRNPEPMTDLGIHHKTAPEKYYAYN
jgi:hypothetical protein